MSEKKYINHHFKSKNKLNFGLFSQIKTKLTIEKKNIEIKNSAINAACVCTSGITIATKTTKIKVFFKLFVGF